jgi:hypothetical protein
VASYLVVAHQTADSPELAAALRAVRARHPDSTFVLVVPATHVEHLVGWTEGEARAAATQAGTKAVELLKRHGIELAAVRVGDADPVNAAVDEWNDHPEYDEVILSTLPEGVSRWLRVDAYDRLERRMSIPVTHVVAEARH